MTSQHSKVFANPSRHFNCLIARRHARAACTNKQAGSRSKFGRRDLDLAYPQLDKGIAMVPQNPLDNNTPVDLQLPVHEVANWLKVSSQVVHELAGYCCISFNLD